MIVLSNEDVAALLPIETAIECVAAAMKAVSSGKTEMPLRSIMPVGGPNYFGMMPGGLSDPACYGIKLVSLFPGNPDHGYSSHQGAMVLFEAEHGSVVSIMNAGLLTAIRTAAASAVATRELARANASVLTIVGNGEQAEHHLEAMVTVRPVRQVRVVGRRAPKVSAFVDAAQKRFPDLDINGGTDVAGAVKDADIVCTATASPDPVLFGEMVSPGTHLNIVGASIPSKREIDSALVLRSRIYADSRASMFAQAGEVVDAIKEGLIEETHVRGEIGEVLSGSVAGRGNDEEITLYRSLGVIAQDLACAGHVTAEARERGMGVNANLD